MAYFFIKLTGWLDDMGFIEHVFGVSNCVNLFNIGLDLKTNSPGE